LGAAFDVTIAQQFQKCEASASRGTVRAISLRGRALTMLWNDGSRTWRLSGSLDRGRLYGIVGTLAEEAGRGSWSAERE
jgi:hypothetical protein